MNIDEIKKQIKENSISSVSIEYLVGINSEEHPQDYQLIKSKFEALVNEATSNMINANKRYRNYICDLSGQIMDGKITDRNIGSVSPSILEVASDLENKVEIAKFTVRLFNSLFQSKD